MNLPLRLKGWTKKVKVSHPEATSSKIKGQMVHHCPSAISFLFKLNASKQEEHSTTMMEKKIGMP